MRPIEFRGKRKDNGEWVCGNLIINPAMIHVNGLHPPQELTVFIREQIRRWRNQPNDKCWTYFSYKVLPKTVGQYTGFKSRDGVKIFEGDKIALSYGIPTKVDTLIIGYVDDETVANNISVSGWWMHNTRRNGYSSSLCKTYEDDIEVIGNIHEGKP